MYVTRNHCRACGYARPGAQGIKSASTESLTEVFDLGIQPLANDFCAADEEHSGYAPLKVLFCPRCSLGQLSVVVRPELLYRKYSYVTSGSEMMKRHFEQLIADIKSETEGKTVLEIGSNDGKLLALMQNRGFSTMGVDPAENLASVARGYGIPTTIGFFDYELARNLSPSDIIIARHVFCHVDDWHDFMRGIEQVTFPSSLICIETPYVGDLLQQGEFDTIYHEHLSYLSLRAMGALLAQTRLHLHRVIRYPIHGGAILIMLRRNDSGLTSDHETSDDQFTVSDWQAFSREAKIKIDRLGELVRGLRSQGKRVAGLGASAKSTVWINACGFRRQDVAFIADNTPQKQWTMTPGGDIPIVDEGALLRELPDYVLCFAWNFREEILDKNSSVRRHGVKFVFPIPSLEVV